MSWTHLMINMHIHSLSRQKPMSKAMGPPRHTGRAASSVLNLDILCHILLFVETHKDLLATMMTCHTLYNAGTQPLVQLPIKIYADTIRPFHDFMLSHSPATFLAFREFLIDCDDLSPQDTDLILELLKRGSTLRRLELPHTVFDGNEGIGEAVASLTNLEELTVEGGYHAGIDRILARLHSPLAEISIYFESEHGNAADTHNNPVLLLANFQSTLERATIISAPFLSVDICYPKLLDLELHLSGGPCLSILATAFPNLQTLFIRTDTEMEVGELWTLRNQNIIFQDGRKCWEFLTVVNADYVALYAMGLERRIKCVTIASIETLTSIHCSFLRTVLSATRTGALSLHLPDTPGILSEVFRDMGYPVVALQLTLDISWEVDHQKTLASTSLRAPSSRALLTVIDYARTICSKASVLPTLSCFILRYKSQVVP